MTTKTAPWYKHRWPWILMVGPAVVIVAGFITAWLAIESNDGLVDDNYYKVGLSVNQQLKQKQLAAELNLKAVMNVSQDGQSIQLVLNGLPKEGLPDTLQVRLVHPTRKGEDQTLMLHRQGTIFSAPLTANPGTGRWKIVIEDPLAGWRMDGVWDIQSKTGITIFARPQ
jgi:hypothetical protein